MGLRGRRSLIGRGRQSKRKGGEPTPVALPDDRDIERLDDPTVMFARSDPDFEETEIESLAGVLVEETESLAGALIEDLPPLTPHPIVIEEARPDEGRSVSSTILRMVRNLFTSAIPASAPPGPASDLTPPLDLRHTKRDETPSFDSFLSRTNEETSRQVKEALARMERGEDPFEE